ncbi:hypothetical protein BFV94_4374 [Alteromonas macleodii]|uniref:Uncharacterized protein n=1 Tax=Alteromonas macleodii TaxID=28108 RepID=A0AB36FMS0_ALTMA|nr:hypothetical protein BFV95_4731 [Alteromonas macleodii]OES25521.1 hypothetical protein BFV94_4374 [Alteromonas macleodii]OES38657.1 hypothetical protein BFV96_4768 [Alteromonas macleodii]
MAAIAQPLLNKNSDIPQTSALRLCSLRVHPVTIFIDQFPSSNA